MNLPHPHLYGLLGEFDSPKQLMDAAKKVREAGYRRIDAFVPFPVEGLSQALGLGRKHDLVPVLTLVGGLGRRTDGILFPALGERVVVSDGHRRPPAEQLAGVYSGDVRTDDFGCIAFRGFWNAGVEQAAAAASPAVQCGTVQARIERQILFVHRIARSEISPGRNRAVLAEHQCPARDGGAR